MAFELGVCVTRVLSSYMSCLFIKKNGKRVGWDKLV